MKNTTRKIKEGKVVRENEKVKNEQNFVKFYWHYNWGHYDHFYCIELYEWWQKKMANEYIQISTTTQTMYLPVEKVLAYGACGALCGGVTPEILQLLVDSF